MGRGYAYADPCGKGKREEGGRGREVTLSCLMGVVGRYIFSRLSCHISPFFIRVLYHIIFRLFCLAFLGKNLPTIYVPFL